MKKLFTLLSAVLVCLGASAQNQKLADVIKATTDTCKHEVVPVFLDGTKTYELDSYVDLGTKRAIIWGGGATIIVSGEGQIATSTQLIVRNANFDCAAGTVAPIALSKTPDASLLANGAESAIKFEGANQQYYWNAHTVSIEKCNFANLKTSLFWGNKQKWALYTLRIQNCIAQLEGKSIDPVISFVGASTGAIKNIELTNNTFYNITADNTSSWFLRYGNSSNARPSKLWGTGATATIKMYNNTILFPGKHFANNTANDKTVTLDWKKNIFINTPNINRVGGNCTRVFAAEDNIITNTTESNGNGSDFGKFGVEENLQVTVPTTALNLANINELKAYFAPAFASTANVDGYGDPRWVTQFKSGIVKYPGQAYEVVLGPDMVNLDKYVVVGDCKETDLGKVKPGIDVETYPWIYFERRENALNNGQYEAKVAERWTNINPATGVTGEWLQATGANGSVKCPVVSQRSKMYMYAYVKDATKFVVYGTGSASIKPHHEAAIKLTATGTDGSVVEATSTPGLIFGKGSGSDLVAVELNPEVAYSIKIEAISNIQDDNTDAKMNWADIQITGFNIYGVDTTPFPACHAPGEKYPGTNYEVVLGPDMLDLVNLTLQANCAEDQIGVVKPGINTEAYPWIKYVRGDDKNVLSNGQHEAQKSNRWTDINPTTGVKGEWLQATGANGSVESPVISGQWNKWMEANVMNATKFTVYATGSCGAKAEDGMAVKLTATSNAGDVVEATTTPGVIFGKGSGSDVVSVNLDPKKAYVIKIEAISNTSKSDIQITGFNLTGTDLTIAPAEGDPSIGGATGIENVEEVEVDVNAPAYNIAGQRVNESAKGIIIKGGKKFINK